MQKSTSWLLVCSLRGSLVSTFEVTLSRNWESCKDNLHLWCLIIFSGILGNSRGLGGIRGHALGDLGLFLIHPRLLSHLWRVARGGKGLLRSALFWIGHLWRSVCLRVARERRVDGFRVIEIFYLPKCRGTLTLVWLRVSSHTWV